MKVYYDLHIHSILSACADVLNTPNNIMNMSMLKELDMISIADHNSMLQYQAIDKIKDSYDFLTIYGMEVTVKEGFHVLTYFKNFDEIEELGTIVDSYLDKNNNMFGKQVLGLDANQIVTDEYDEENQNIAYLLNQKSISFSDLIKETKRLNGIIIPAHIDRKGTGILDFIEDFSEYDIDGIEIYNIENIENLYIKYPYLKKYKFISNSDAHDIDKIHEKEFYLELDSLSFDSLKKYFKGE